MPDMIDCCLGVLDPSSQDIFLASIAFSDRRLWGYWLIYLLHWGVRDIVSKPAQSAFGLSRAWLLWQMIAALRWQEHVLVTLREVVQGDVLGEGGSERFQSVSTTRVRSGWEYSFTTIGTSSIARIKLSIHTSYEPTSSSFLLTYYSMSNGNLMDL